VHGLLGGSPRHGAESREGKLGPGRMELLICRCAGSPQTFAILSWSSEIATRLSLMPPLNYAYPLQLRICPFFLPPTGF